MPSFRNQLNDAEVAAVATCVRNRFGNAFSPIDTPVERQGSAPAPDFFLVAGAQLGTLTWTFGIGGPAATGASLPNVQRRSATAAATHTRSSRTLDRHG